MKIPYIKPVRSLALDTIFKPSKNKTRRGLTKFVSKLDQMTGNDRFEPRNSTYNVLTKKFETVVNRRIAVVKSKGKGRFHAIGFGPFEGTFDALRNALAGAGFTHTKFINNIKPVK